MPQAVIENPVINSPFEEPRCHFRFADVGMNQSLGFAIPYTINGEEHNYIPDFIARLDDGHGREDPLNLIIEVTGERDKDKAAKTDTARTLWVPRSTTTAP